MKKNFLIDKYILLNKLKFDNKIINFLELKKNNYINKYTFLIIKIFFKLKKINLNLSIKNLYFLNKKINFYLKNNIIIIGIISSNNYYNIFEIIINNKLKINNYNYINIEKLLINDNFLFINLSFYKNYNIITNIFFKFINILIFLNINNKNFNFNNQIKIFLKICKKLKIIIFYINIKNNNNYNCNNIKKIYFYKKLIKKTLINKISKNLFKLIEKISLIYENFKNYYNKNYNFYAFVLNSYIDKNLGVVVKIFIFSGFLDIKDLIISNKEIGRIKKIFNNNNNNLYNTNNYKIVNIVAFSKLKNINSIIFKLNKNFNLKKKNIFNKFLYIKNKLFLNKIKKYDKNNNFKKGSIYKILEDNNSLIKTKNIIIKLNDLNLFIYIKKILKNFKKSTFNLNVLYFSLGEVNLNDLKKSKITNSNIIILYLRNYISKKLLKINKNYNVELIYFNNIYLFLKYLKKLEINIKNNLKIYNENKEINIKIKGKMIVYKIFKVKNKTIAGCKIIKGFININSKILIKRNKNVIFNGFIKSLKKFQKEYIELRKNEECGIYIDIFNNYELNDIIESYL